MIAAGLDPDNLPPKPDGYQGGHKRAWKQVWSAGQGVGSIADVPSVADLCARLRTEYAEACAGFTAARPEAAPRRAVG
jgi:nitronate monooxygenase